MFTVFRALDLIATPPLPAARQNTLRVLRLPARPPQHLHRLTFTQQFSLELKTEAKFILTLLITLIGNSVMIP